MAFSSCTGRTVWNFQWGKLSESFFVIIVTSAHVNQPFNRFYYLNVVIIREWSKVHKTPDLAGLSFTGRAEGVPLLEFKLSSCLWEWQSLSQWKPLLQQGLGPSWGAVPSEVTRLSIAPTCSIRGPFRRSTSLLYTLHVQDVNGASEGCNGAHTRVQIMTSNNSFMDIIISYGCHSVASEKIKALLCKLFDEYACGPASAFLPTASVRQDIKSVKDSPDFWTMLWR